MDRTQPTRHPSSRRRASLVSILLAALALPGVVQAEAGNDDRAHPSTIPAARTSIPFDLTDATLGASEGACTTTRETRIAQHPAAESLVLPATDLLEPAPGLWYRFDAPANGTLAISLRRAPLATLAVYTPETLVMAACLTADDHLDVTEGASYELVLAQAPEPKYERVPLTGWLEVEFFPRSSVANDAQADAAPLGVDATVRAHTFDAHPDPVACGARPAIWYRVVSPIAAVLDASLELSGSPDPRATIVAIDETDAYELACDETFSTRVTSLFTLQPGRPVLIGVGALDAVLEVHVRTTPIADLVSQPAMLGMDPIGYSTADATLEAGESDACGGGRSVWFQIAPSDEDRTLRLDGFVSAPGATTTGMERYVNGVAASACSEQRGLAIPAGFDGLVRLASTDALSGRARLLASRPLGALHLTDDSPLPMGCASMSGITMHSEVEPNLAISPIDPDHLIASWQQDRDANGGALTLLTATSFDGGDTWTMSHPGGVSRCGFGPFLRATDPWVSIGSNGVAYLTTLGIGGPVTDQNAIIVQRSDDGGLAWGTPTTINVERGLLSNDKQVLLVDPNDPAKIYLAWAMVLGGALRSVLARSLDGGDTWLPPIPLPTAAATPIGDQLVITDDGDLVHVVNHSVAGYVQAMRSRDGGLTWTPPARLGSSTGAEGPNGVRGGNMMPDVTTDGDRVYVTWLDPSNVWLATSSPDALSWSTRRIGSSTGRFTPSIAATDAGALTVTSYRFDGADVVMTQLVERDGGFIERVISEPFAIELAPNIPGRGRFLGDYTGLVARGDGFVSLHAMTLDGDADLYVQQLPT